MQKGLNIFALLMLVATLPACCWKCKESCNPCRETTCEEQEDVAVTKVHKKVTTIPVKKATVVKN